MVTVFVVLFSIDVCAQENERGVRFGGGADVVSGYIWRGVWEAGPSIQPTLVLSAGNFSATAWGSAGIGIVPWNAYGTYGIDRDFYVQNVFLNAGKSWTVAGSLQLGLFTSLSWNPALEDVNFVGGISLRM